jgi:hypothetical protein
VSNDAASAAEAPESRSGLEPWKRAELPAPPNPRGLAWLGVVGPGVIVLGLSIGSGEFLLGPAAFVRHGLSLLWVSSVAIFFQTIFNTELMRYTVATGEPVFTGFMRTRPSPTVWASFYSLLFFLQVGWPAWAATGAGAMFFMGVGKLAGPGDASTIYLIGVGTFLACVAVLLIGRRISRTLEILNWIMVSCILGSFLVLALIFVKPNTWFSALVGFAGFDTKSGTFIFLPQGANYFLLGALVAYSGCGGILNITLANWARDKGYGMGSRSGYISAAVGGQKVTLAHTGFIFDPNAEAMGRFRGWWRIVRADQWGVFFVGALLGMSLPALLYVTFVPRGTDIVGLGISAILASSVGAVAGPALAMLIGILGAWLLFKTQLDIIEGTTRSITEILWTGSSRLRAWRGGDVRMVYYAVLAVIVAWGVFALKLAAPVVLLQISANVAGVVFVFATPHLLYVNTRLLPPELRPPMWRRGALVAMTLFYAFFAVLSISSLV